MIEIPVANFKEKSADFELNIDLENINTTIRLTYNTRVDYWFATFTTPNKTLKGIKLVTEYLLLDQLKPLIFDLPGDFIVSRIDNDYSIPVLDYENFGGDWAFYYLTEDEVTAWKAERNL